MTIVSGKRTFQTTQSTGNTNSGVSNAKDGGAVVSQKTPSSSMASGSGLPKKPDPPIEKMSKKPDFRKLVLYTQSDILRLKPGEKLPAIKNPGLEPYDILCELVEGRDYNPDDYVQLQGHDMFVQGNDVFLLGTYVNSHIIYLEI